MDYARVLETYSLAEILEYNDCTEEEVLELLIKHQVILSLPPEPVDSYREDNNSHG